MNPQLSIYIVFKPNSSRIPLNLNLMIEGEWIKGYFRSVVGFVTSVAT